MRGLRGDPGLWMMETGTLCRARPWWHGQDRLGSPASDDPASVWWCARRPESPGAHVQITSCGLSLSLSLERDELWPSLVAAGIDRHRHRTPRSTTGCVGGAKLLLAQAMTALTAPVLRLRAYEGSRPFDGALRTACPRAGDWRPAVAVRMPPDALSVDHRGQLPSKSHCLESSRPSSAPCSGGPQGHNTSAGKPSATGSEWSRG